MVAEPTISSDTDVCRCDLADIASVEVPQPTQYQSEFMAVLCMKEQIKEGVSNTTHIITQEIISVMLCVWIDVGHEAYDIYQHGYLLTYLVENSTFSSHRQDR